MTARLAGGWDRSHLERVLANLFANALKYSPPGGAVVATIAREANNAVLRVSDRGVGIPARDLPHIFEPFFRGSNVAAEYPGTGLGLAGVRRIVTEQGGSISIESEEGAGTTVTVLLPLLV